MLVVSEGSKIRKKREEEERRKMMAEGFHKLQDALNEKIAAREAVQAINSDLKAVHYNFLGGGNIIAVYRDRLVFCLLFFLFFFAHPEASRIK